VPSLTLPPLRAGLCEYLRITAHEHISAEELAELRSVAGQPPGDDMFYIEAIRIGSELADGRARLAERVYVLEAATTEVASGSASSDAPGNGPARAELRIEIVLSVAKSPSVPADSDSERLSAVLDWIRAKRDITVEVMGGTSFARDEYASVVSLPDPVPPFTSVIGLTLARESDESEESARAPATAYETQLRMRDDKIFVTARFRARFHSDAEALVRILDNASEIAGFAMRRRQVAPS
jgi:hypothetical protein